MKRYNPKEIEPKWQQKWEDDGTYVVDFDSKKPKYVAFGMFNYPSGAGIHVGHVRNFTIPDVITRVKRQQGYESYQPVGWDSFGMPAENYAIKTGVAPQVSIKQAIEKYHEQYRAMGWAMDWTKEIDTTEPEYYRWTQWCFAKLFENGLAYQQESPQWWCDQCKTVLADEQVIAGKCWRHDGDDDPMVTKRSLKQWFFRITEFADEMLEATDDLNWTQSVKSSQKSWIGRSVGAEINFQIASAVIPTEAEGSDEISRQARNDVRSYIMGQKNITEADIKSIGGHVVETTDDGHLCVVFPRESAKEFEELISEKIEPGFWNEYLGEDAVFIFKNSDSAITRLVWTLETESEILELCNQYAKANFENVESMLLGNNFYKDWILNRAENDSSDVIKVFTTRPDTLFGATFIVLAPEHPLVDKLTIESQKAEVEAYKEVTNRKSEVQRQQDADKEKTGVFTGSYAINPANGEKIPIWIADYILMGYGTGAIMAVPAHDERDFEFAQKFSIPVRQVIAPYITNSGNNMAREGVETRERMVVDAIIKNQEGEYLLIDEGDNIHFVGGGLEGDEDDLTALRREVIEESGYSDIDSIRQVSCRMVTYAYRIPKKVNQRVEGAVYEVVLASSKQQASEADDGKHSLRWVKKEDVADLLSWEGHALAWSQYLASNMCYADEGVLINSGEYNKLPSSEAREKIVADLAKQGIAQEKVNYKMRDWLISRQRYWGAPIPIIHCEKDGAVLVPDADLPVVLPVLEDYRPTGGNVSALAGAEEWVNTTCPKCGGPGKRETDTMDGYVCSSWYFLRYMDPTNNQKAWDEKQASKWMPVDCYNGGDHATAHLLYARFFNRFFHKLGYIDTKEPFKRMIFHGKIKAGDGSAFSKSKGNGIDPLEVIEQGYGADAIRLYQMFAAPLELDVLWDQQGIPGAFRYLSRVWTLVQEFIEADQTESSADSKQSLLRITHAAIKKVSEEINGDRFNTAIAALMECTNSLYKEKTTNGIQKSEQWQFALESLLQLLAPFAPHMSEELWQDLGNNDTIHVDHWPVHDESYLTSDVMKIVVQTNGKVRATIEVSVEASEEEVIEAAKANEKVAIHIGDNPIKKSIYVPKKLINFVV